jgi:hypothetical protein
MANVPNQAILRSVEDIMKGEGQFYDPQAGCQMPAGSGNRVDDFLPDFLGQQRKIGKTHFT